MTNSRGLNVRIDEGGNLWFAVEIFVHKIFLYALFPMGNRAIKKDEEQMPFILVVI